jgi:hypothetical protein
VSLYVEHGGQVLNKRVLYAILGTVLSERVHDQHCLFLHRLNHLHRLSVLLFASLQHYIFVRELFFVQVHVKPGVTEDERILWSYDLLDSEAFKFTRTEWLEQLNCTC